MSNIDEVKKLNEDGKTFFGKEEYDKAIESFSKAIKLNPEDGEAYNNRGSVYGKKGKYGKAIADYTKAIEITPDFAKAYYNRGTAYGSNGEYDKAIADCTKAIEFNPDFAEAYYNRGNAYGANGEYDKAIDDCTKAIEIIPYYAKAYFNRGNAYGAKGEYDKAIDDYTKAIGIKPGFAGAYYNRGVTYGDKGEYDKAIDDCTKAIEFNPDFAEAYVYRGISYVYKKQYDKAIKDYTKAIELNPNYVGAYYNLGIIYKAQGEYDKATYNYKIAFEFEADNKENIADFIFKYINVLNDGIFIDDKKFNIEYIIKKLLESDNLWKNKIYTDNDIKKLSICEHILLHFLTLKEEDAINEVAYYISTRVLEKLIKKEENQLSTIRMSTLSKVNDPAEGKVLLGILNKYAKKSIEEERNIEEDYAVQTSFTRCIDSLTMFRLYGKNENLEGTGVSLVFDKIFFDTAFQYNELPTSTEKEVIQKIGNNKQPLYYVLYHDKKTDELIFNPYKSNYKKIRIKLNELNKYKYFKYPENYSSPNEYKYEYSKVENNIGYLLNQIFSIMKNLEGENIQKGYKALANIKYLIKNSAFTEEQELRILRVVKYNKVLIDHEIKSVYRKYFEAVSYNALKQIILGPKIKDVQSVAETWRVYIKQEAEKDKRYEGIEVLISDAPFN